MFIETVIEVVKVDFSGAKLFITLFKDDNLCYIRCSSFMALYEYLLPVVSVQYIISTVAVESELFVYFILSHTEIVCR